MVREEPAPLKPSRYDIFKELSPAAVVSKVEIIASPTKTVNSVIVILLPNGDCLEVRTAAKRKHIVVFCRPRRPHWGDLPQ